MMSRIPGGIKKIVIIKLFWSYCPLQIWPLKTCNPDISKIILARSFKFVQQIQDGEFNKLMVMGIVFHKHNF